MADGSQHLVQSMEDATRFDLNHALLAWRPKESEDKDATFEELFKQNKWCHRLDCEYVVTQQGGNR